MSQSILYSRSPCTLKQVAHSTCPAGVSEEVYESLLLESNQHYPTLATTSSPQKPIILTGQADQPQRANNLQRIFACNRDQHKVLADLSTHCGGSAVMGLAAMMWDTKLPSIVGDLNTFGGSGISVATAKSSKIIAAVNDYDLSLARYHDLENHRAAPRTIRAAKTQVELAFRAMNEQFSKASLNYLNNSEYKMRAAKTVTGKDVWESIPVRDNADVIKLEKLAKFGRYGGPSFVIFDGYLRANKVHHMRQDSNPAWKREAMVQTGAFLMGIAAGTVITALLVPTAVGFGVTFVAAGIAAYAMDKLATGFANLFFD